MLAELRAQEPPFAMPTYSTHCAAAHCRTAALAYLLAAGVPPNTEALAAVGKGGHADCVRALLTAGAPPQEAAIHFAASGRVSPLELLLAEAEAELSAAEVAAARAQAVIGAGEGTSERERDRAAVLALLDGWRDARGGDADRRERG